MTALLGTFVNVKTMADGTPRLVLDLQCTLAEIAALGLIPGTPFGIARITGESSVAGHPQTRATAGVADDFDTPADHQQAAQKQGPLCILACQWCKDPEFWEFISHDGQVCNSEEAAKNDILLTCGIESRRELDRNPRAADDFHEFIREPFMCWKAAQ